MSARDVLDQIRQRAEEDLRYSPSMRAKERIEATLRQNAALVAVLDLAGECFEAAALNRNTGPYFVDPRGLIDAITDHLRSDRD